MKNPIFLMNRRKKIVNNQILMNNAKKISMHLIKSLNVLIKY